LRRQLALGNIKLVQVFELLQIAADALAHTERRAEIAGCPKSQISIYLRLNTYHSVEASIRGQSSLVLVALVFIFIVAIGSILGQQPSSRKP
jgi:hypothetical protein